MTSRLSCVKGKRQNCWSTLLDAPVIDESGTLNERIVNLRATLPEFRGRRDAEHDNITSRNMCRCHATFRFIETCHTIDPGIHVSSIEGREAEYLGEHIVERIPIRYFAA